MAVMQSGKISEKISDDKVKTQLLANLETISSECTECGLCVKECAFLRKYGTPKFIADSYDPEANHCQRMSYECSLCQLCAAACPVKLNPTDMFLDMRREAFFRKTANYSKYSAILGYERRGTSQRYTHYSLPADCDTIFFPGCTLPGALPTTVLNLYEHLKKNIPALGIVLDCCSKPSHDLGMENSFHTCFHTMKTFLVRKGIQKILVACPNCYKIFKEYGGDLSVKTVYETIDETLVSFADRVKGTVSIHDPCPVRFEEQVHTAIRSLAGKVGLTVEEMAHHGRKTLCCGEGGSVGFINPGLAKAWGGLRKSEANDRRIITYCSGCVNFLGTETPTSHILDLIYEPEAAMSGKTKIARAPFTYWNRLRLKSKLQKLSGSNITRKDVTFDLHLSRRRK